MPSKKVREAVHAVIVAAGEGRRAGLIGGTTKKQFAVIAGRPVIIHTLAAFQNTPAIDTLTCVVAKEDRDYFNNLIKCHPLPKIKAVVEGGACRQESVAAGLVALEKAGSSEEIVLVHDGVRPMVSQVLIEHVIEAARQHGGAVAACPVADSLKIVSGQSFIQTSLSREAVWAMQTPQAFRLGLLMEAIKKGMAEEFIGTDEAAFVERLGHPVFCVEGSTDNLKITTESDLRYVETLLKLRGG